jgi:hypothetical protein
MSDFIDDLARNLAKPTSRRQTLRVLFGAAVAVLLSRPAFAALCPTTGGDRFDGCPCDHNSLTPQCQTGLSCTQCFGSGTYVCSPPNTTCCKLGNTQTGGGAKFCGAGQCCCVATNKCAASSIANGSQACTTSGC